jgi:phosphatidylinositol glycan class B
MKPEETRGESEKGQPVKLLVAFLGLAFLLRLPVALGYPNIVWPDEIFQTLEQAHRLAFGYGIVPWEFRAGTRCWLLPGLLAGLMRVGGELGSGSAPYLVTVTAALCALSLLPVAAALLWGHRVGGARTALVTGTLAAVWFELVYFAPKALYEVVAAHLLLPALYLARFDDGRRGRQLLSGLLMGAALGLRIQLAPAVLCALIYLCRADTKSKCVRLAGAAAAALALCGLLDLVTWKYPFQSIWYGFYVNVFQGKSLLWGAHPWYHYFRVMARVWSWAALPLAALVVLGARKYPLLLITAAAVVLTHSLVAHKEYRFIYPALPMLVIVAGGGLGRLQQWIEKITDRRWLAGASLAAMLLACCLTSLSLAPRFDASRTGVELVTDGPSHWRYFRAPLRIFLGLSRDDRCCGLGLRHVHWALTGGYAYLHRDIPLFAIGSARGLRDRSPGFNYLLARGVAAPRLGRYALLGCQGSYCLYRRPGSCEPRAGYHLNRLLEKRGE